MYERREDYVPPLPGVSNSFLSTALHYYYNYTVHLLNPTDFSAHATYRYAIMQCLVHPPGQGFKLSSLTCQCPSTYPRFERFEPDFQVPDREVYVLKQDSLYVFFFLGLTKWVPGRSVLGVGSQVGESRAVIDKSSYET